MCRWPTGTVNILVVVMVVAGSVVGGEPASEPAEGPTDYAALNRFIREYTDEVEGGGGRWSFTIEEAAVMVLADRAADRMRIMTPVARVADFKDGEYQRLMEANYDRALDARYAIHGGVLWSAFIHPMSSVSHQQFDDGLEQVIRLSANFGTTYASSDMVFAPGGQPPGEQPGEDKTPQQPDENEPPAQRGAPPAPRT
jgi:hypothetical protein